MPEADGQVFTWLPVRCVEGALFRGMLIAVQPQIKGMLNLRYLPFHVDIKAITRGADHLEAICLGETNNCIVVLLAWSKSLGEFFDRKVLMVRRTGRIRDGLNEVLQLCLIGELQSECEAQSLIAAKVFHRFRRTKLNRLRHVVCERVPRLSKASRLNNGENAGKKDRAKQAGRLKCVHGGSLSWVRSTA